MKMVYRKPEMTLKPSKDNVLHTGLIKLNLKQTGQAKCNQSKVFYVLKRP